MLSAHISSNSSPRTWNSLFLTVFPRHQAQNSSPASVHLLSIDRRHGMGLSRLEEDLAFISVFIIAFAGGAGSWDSMQTAYWSIPRHISALWHDPPCNMLLSFPIVLIVAMNHEQFVKMREAQSFHQNIKICTLVEFVLSPEPPLLAGYFYYAIILPKPFLLSESSQPVMFVMFSNAFLFFVLSAIMNAFFERHSFSYYCFHFYNACYSCRTKTLQFWRPFCPLCARCDSKCAATILVSKCIGLLGVVKIHISPICIIITFLWWK